MPLGCQRSQASWLPDLRLTSRLLYDLLTRRQRLRISSIHMLLIHNIVLLTLLIETTYWWMMNPTRTRCRHFHSSRSRRWHLNTYRSWSRHLHCLRLGQRDPIHLIRTINLVSSRRSSHIALSLLMKLWYLVSLLAKLYDLVQEVELWLRPRITRSLKSWSL
jgi:hypothetical protein